MKMKKNLIAAAILATGAGAALADITIGISLPLTGPTFGVSVGSRHPDRRFRVV